MLILFFSLNTGFNKNDLSKEKISLRISAYWKGIKGGDYFNQFKSLSNRLAPHESLLSFYGNLYLKMRRKMYNTCDILHLLHFTAVHMSQLGNRVYTKINNPQMF